MSLTGWSKGWQRGWGSWTGRAARCCAWVLRPGSSFPTRKTLLWDPQTNWSFFSCPGLAPVTGSPSLDSRHGPVTGAASLLGDLAISGALASTELLEYRLLDEVNRFVLSCLAMALIGGPFPKLSSILPNSSSCKSSSIWKSLISHLYRHWHQQSWQLFSSITDPELQSRASLPHYKFCVILLWYWLQDLSLKGEPFPELRVQPLIFGTDWLAVHRDQRRVQERRHWWSFPFPKLRGQPLNFGKRPLP